MVAEMVTVPEIVAPEEGAVMVTVGLLVTTGLTVTVSEFVTVPPLPVAVKV